MHWVKYVPKFIREAIYDAIYAEVTAVTLPVDVPDFDKLKMELMAKIHAILML